MKELSRFDSKLVGAASSDELTFDWSLRHKKIILNGIVDETIRDGLQIPNAPAVSLEIKCELLRHMSSSGIRDVIIGMVSPQQIGEIQKLFEFIKTNNLPLFPWVLCRCNVDDLTRILDVKKKVDFDFGINFFISTSKIRSYVEDWAPDENENRLKHCMQIAACHFYEMRVAFEDATRSDPSTLCSFIDLALHFGATRITLADTAGVSLPGLPTRIISTVLEQCPDILGRGCLEWHGHNDRGMATATSYEALHAGANYIHGTMCGIGERNGNLAIDELLLNLSSTYDMEGDINFEALLLYRTEVERIFGFALKDNTPFFGDSTFASATGTHLAAIEKALSKGRPEVARNLFSPPSWLNERREPRFLISHLTGYRGAAAALRHLGLPTSELVIKRVMEVAQRLQRPMTNEEIQQSVKLQ